MRRSKTAQAPSTEGKIDRSTEQAGGFALETAAAVALWTVIESCASEPCAVGHYVVLRANKKTVSFDCLCG